MNLPQPDIQVNDATAILWGEFLKTASGQEIISVMRASKPPLMRPGESVTFETRAIRATETQTWENCVDFLVSLAGVRSKPKIDPMMIQGEP